MKTHRIPLFLLFILALLIGNQQAAAQGGQGKARIQGLVLDEAGPETVSTIPTEPGQPATRPPTATVNSPLASPASAPCGTYASQSTDERLDRITAESDLTKTKSERVDAIVNYLIAKANLFRATGRPLSEL